MTFIRRSFIVLPISPFLWSLAYQFKCPIKRILRNHFAYSVVIKLQITSSQPIPSAFLLYQYNLSIYCFLTSACGTYSLYLPIHGIFLCNGKSSTSIIPVLIDKPFAKYRYFSLLRLLVYLASSKDSLFFIMLYISVATTEPIFFFCLLRYTPNQAAFHMLSG